MLTPAFKSKATLEALKADRTIAELASEFKLHPNQIGKWKRHLQEHLPELFATRNAHDDYEATSARLYEEIGRLKVDLDFVNTSLMLSLAERRAIREGFNTYFRFYNRERCHHLPNYRTPADLYFER